MPHGCQAIVSACSSHFHLFLFRKRPISPEPFDFTRPKLWDQAFVATGKAQPPNLAVASLPKAPESLITFHTLDLI